MEKHLSVIVPSMNLRFSAYHAEEPNHRVLTPIHLTDQYFGVRDNDPSKSVNDLTFNEIPLLGC